VIYTKFWNEAFLRSCVSLAVLSTFFYTTFLYKNLSFTKTCSATIPGHTEAVLSVNFSPDGRRLASGSGDATVRLWDLGTQTPRFTCKAHNAWVLVVSWSPDAAIVASGDHAGAIWLWDPATGKPMGQCRGHRQFISSLAWEPAHAELPARRFVSGSRDNTVRVWEANTR
jgi:ribosome assembly protein 4